MISDVLAEALVEIENYETDEVLGLCYKDPETQALLAKAKAALRELGRHIDHSPKVLASRMK